MKRLSITKGMVHVYTGDGKGKTTAALGLALRVIGWGGQACMVQFIKGYSDIGEGHFAESHPESFVLKQFTEDQSADIDEAKLRAREKEACNALEYARAVVEGGEYDIVVLDEVNNALHYGLIKVNDVIALVRDRPSHVELVLTGRNAPQEVIDVADYVTEMRAVKHPFERGTSARRGVDY